MESHSTTARCHWQTTTRSTESRSKCPGSEADPEGLLSRTYLDGTTTIVSPVLPGWPSAPVDPVAPVAPVLPVTARMGTTFVQRESTRDRQPLCALSDRRHLASMLKTTHARADNCYPTRPGGEPDADLRRPLHARRGRPRR